MIDHRHIFTELHSQRCTKYALNSAIVRCILNWLRAAISPHTSRSLYSIPHVLPATLHFTTLNAIHRTLHCTHGIQRPD